MSLIVVIVLVLVAWLLVVGLMLGMMAAARHADDQAWRQHRRAARRGEIEVRVRKITPFGGRQETHQ